MMSRYVVRAALPRSTGRAVAAVTVVSAVLAAAACSAAHVTTSGTVDGSAPQAPAATIAGCRVGAWAEDFTDADHLAWQVSLPANPW